MKLAIGVGTALLLVVGCSSVSPSRRAAESSAPGKVADPGAGAKLQLDYATAKLPNGIKLIAIRDDSTDLVEVDVRYQVGAKEDPPGKAGLAHLVEHLTYQARLADGDDTLDTFLRRRALYYNAKTNHESTHYENLTTAAEVEKVVWAEANRLADGCAIDAANFQREREVVRNELRQRDVTPRGEFLRLLREAVMPPGHAYARAEGGDDHQVAGITLADACAFKKRYYVPERTTVVIAGPLAPDEIAKRVLPHLTALPARPGGPLTPVAPLALSRKQVTAELDLGQAAAVAAWAMPRSYTPDDYRARFLADFLKQWIEMIAAREELAAEVQVGMMGDHQAPVLVAMVVPAEAKRVSDAAAAIQEGTVLLLRRPRESLSKDAFDERTFRLYRKRAAGELLASFESLWARTSLFADHAQFAPPDWDLGAEIEALNAVGPRDLEAPSFRLFDPAKCVTIKVTPKAGVPFSYSRDALAWSPSKEDLEAQSALPASRSPLAVPAHASLAGQALRTTLDNGLRLWLLRVPGIPRLVVRLVFPAGSAQEPPGLRGASGWLRSMWPQSGLTEDPAHIVELLDEGTRFRIQPRDDDTVFRVDGISEFAGIAIEGLHGYLAEPHVGVEAFEQQRKRIASELRGTRSRQHRFEIAQLAWFYGAGHPYAAEPDGAALEKLERVAVQSFFARQLAPAGATLIVVGDFDPVAIETQARKLFGRWPARPAPEPPPLAPLLPSVRRLAIAVDPDPLVEVGISYPAPRLTDAAGQAARLVLVNMLGAAAGTVRDRRGASYGIHAALDERRAADRYVIEGAVDALRAGEAFVALRSAIASILSDAGFEDAFLKARRQVVRGLLAESRSLDAIAHQLVEQASTGKPADHFDRLLAALRDMKPATVRTLAKQDLRPDREIIVLMGEKKVVQAAYAAAGIRGYDLHPN